MSQQRATTIIQPYEPATPEIEARANNIEKESFDCGITALGWCNTPGCHKLATSKAFLTVMVLVGITLGMAEMYFIISTRQAAVEHNYSPTTVGWLLMSRGIFEGLFACFIAYWGNRIHRPAWLGGILIFQAVTCIAVMIPTIANTNGDINSIPDLTSSQLCQISGHSNIARSGEKPYWITSLVMLFILQLGLALGNVSYYTLGLSFMDDNTKEHISPSLLGGALAAKFWGIQWGSALSLLVGATPLGWWLGWCIIGPSIFILGCIIGLFPRRLLSTLVKQAANNIIETATNSSLLLNPSKLLADVSFGKSMRRLIGNKILIFNVIAAVFVETAIINFFFYEHEYLQSRFLLPTNDANGLQNEWTSRFITKLLRPPIVALAVLVAALIIAKANPNPRKLAAWNVVTGLIVMGLFIGYIFIDCPTPAIAGTHRDKLNTPYCSHNCLCAQNTRFQPVCPEDSVYTYFSPCYAGCREESFLNDIRVFANCSCSVDTGLAISPGVRATEGACNYAECQVWIVTFQILTVFGAALLASGVIGNLIISLRSVLPQDKSLALSLELWLVGLIAHIPGKLGYGAIAENNCQYWSNDMTRCYLHDSPSFGDWLNIVTATLIGIGVIFDIFVFIFVKNMRLYGETPEDAYTPIETTVIRRPPAPPIPVNTAPAEHEPFIPMQTLHSPVIQTIQQTQSGYRSDRSVSPNDSVRSIDKVENVPTNRSLAVKLPTKIENEYAASLSTFGGARNRSASPSVENGSIQDGSDLSNTGVQRPIRPLSPETNF